MNDTFYSVEKILRDIEILKELLYESFEFTATKFEIYEKGQCIKNGICNSVIKASIYDNSIFFHIENNELDIDNNFSFLLREDDLLMDRIQYGRLPRIFYAKIRKTLPVVCNIFPNANIIRFATLNPLRLTEFTGTIKKL